MIENIITKIYLQNFRNFKEYEINTNNSTIFIGNNGIGKTTILEAISLVCGRGIRSANYSEILNYNYPEKSDWLVLIEIRSNNQINKIVAEYKNSKKIIKINGKQVKNLNEILEYLKIFWITQADYHQILISNSHRRDFFDRTISQFIPDYHNYLVKYKYCLLERNKILTEMEFNIANYDTWLSEIEKNLVKLNFIISKIRAEIVEKVNDLSDNNLGLFNPKIKLFGAFEESKFSEDDLLQFLKRNRVLHSQIKRCNIGIHLTKIEITDCKKNKDISLLSSGEQRLLLNQLVINLVKMQTLNDESKPIMLLDDILTFFDDTNQNFLIERLLELDLQFFVTTNQLKLNDFIINKLQIFTNFIKE